jgi:membrane-bound ClpP family serine protease
MVTGWVISLFILGLILVMLEVIVPGGILGIAGIVLWAAGVFMLADSVVQGLAYVCIMLIALGVLIALSFKFPLTQKFWRRLSLSTRQSNSEGYVAPSQDLEKFLGREGVSISLLRPAGTADFDGVRLDVVTEGGFIDRAARIKVIAVEGTRVVVREISESTESKC